MAWFRFLPALLAVGLTSSAVPADEPLTLEQIRAMDADKDGLISQAEYAGQREDLAGWAQMDANGDGVLDQDEQRRNTQPAPAVRFD